MDIMPASRGGVKTIDFDGKFFTNQDTDFQYTTTTNVKTPEAVFSWKQYPDFSSLPLANA